MATESKKKFSKEFTLCGGPGIWNLMTSLGRQRGIQNNVEATELGTAVEFLCEPVPGAVSSFLTCIDTMIRKDKDGLAWYVCGRILKDGKKFPFAAQYNCRDRTGKFYTN